MTLAGVFIVYLATKNIAIYSIFIMVIVESMPEILRRVIVGTIDLFYKCVVAETLSNQLR